MAEIPEARKDIWSEMVDLIPRMQDAVNAGLARHIAEEHGPTGHQLAEHRMDELASLSRAIAIFQQKYVFDILFVLSGMTELYFNDIRRMINYINPTTLTKRLKYLESHRIIDRIVHPGRPVRVSYRLTTLGRGSFGLLLPLLVYVEYFDTSSKSKLQV
ncbi:MAG: winged helix-turn-helix transcriptional regulator [Promethearchaeota archaeon]